MSSFTAVGHRSAPNVRDFDAAASGMAGVGSSTAAVNLTRAFTSQGNRVGREVWGYSAPQVTWNMTLRSASSHFSYLCRSKELMSCRSTCSSRKANWSRDQRHGPEDFPSNTNFRWEYVVRSRQAIAQKTRNYPLELLSLLAGPVARTVRSTSSTPTSMKGVC